MIDGEVNERAFKIAVELKSDNPYCYSSALSGKSWRNLDTLIAAASPSVLKGFNSKSVNLN